MSAPLRRPALDVSGLPGIGFGHREPIWWGVLLLTLIEGTAFALLLAAYFYVRGNEDQWPPTAVSAGAYASAALGVLVLLASTFTMLRSDKFARLGDPKKVRLWLGLSIVLGLVMAGARIWELVAIPFRWDTHAYGSVFWVTVCLHMFHAVTATGENLALWVVLTFKRVEKHHMADVEANGFYWYFVVLSGWAIYAVFYLDPRVLETLP